MVSIVYNENLEERIAKGILTVGQVLLKNNLSEIEEQKYFASLFFMIGLAEENGIDTDTYLGKINKILEKRPISHMSTYFN